MPEPVASEVASAAAAVASGHVSGRLGSRWSRAGPAACVVWAYKCSMTTHGTNGFEGQICSLCLFSNEIACFRHYVGQDLTWAIRTVSPWSGTRESLDGQRTPRTHTTQVAIMLLDLVVLASWCTRARYVRYYVYSVRFDFGELRNLLCALHTPCGGAHDARSSPRKALTKGWQMCPRDRPRYMRSPRDAPHTQRHIGRSKSHAKCCVAIWSNPCQLV